ncbi:MULTISPECIES: hypothetical protein [Pontibacterium]|jgi:hypothetical protein|nr:hypothetical protein [Pontibacterium sinense]
MKKGPDLVAVLVLFFVVGTLMTGISHADFDVPSIVGSVAGN